mmetsp:Transcript_52092/g.86842  ORF Transcript_52092/g.86842 Transcript_52092/m.86842 type:complete len:218 (-) Transcript_52092:1732-2385(-)
MPLRKVDNTLLLHADGCPHLQVDGLLVTYPPYGVHEEVVPQGEEAPFQACGERQHFGWLVLHSPEAALLHCWGSHFPYLMNCNHCYMQSHMVLGHMVLAHPCQGAVGHRQGLLVHVAMAAPGLGALDMTTGSCSLRHTACRLGLASWNSYACHGPNMKIGAKPPTRPAHFPDQCSIQNPSDPVAKTPIDVSTDDHRRWTLTRLRSWQAVGQGILPDC